MKLLDPTAELSPLLRPRRTPPQTLEGKTIALLDIGKTRSDEFLDYLDARIQARGLRTRRYAKPTNTRVASIELVQQIADEADVILSALAD